MKKELLSILSVLFTAILVQAQDITSYRGAFAPAPEPMWTDGWINWDPQNTSYPATTATITAVNNDTTWTTGSVIKISGIVYVASGRTLTIQPGVIVRGDETVANSSLFVTKGAKINAIGTACSPIVFTSNRGVGARVKGDWGGVVLLGQARTNFAGGSQQIEGTAAGDSRNFHGGSNDADNSGTLKYVRIEYGGYVFATNNEINSLTMGSVGSGTTIDHIQCSFGNDDAFEWFGGTVNAKHLVAYRCLDDDFDTDNGYSGTVQYGLSIKDPAVSDVASVSTSEGFESDNDATGTTNFPKTRAKFYNITEIGAFRCSSNSGPAVLPTAIDHRRGARIRRDSDLKIFNSIFMGNRTGLFLDGAAVLANIDLDSAAYRNNIIANDFSTSFTYGGFTGTSIIAENAATRTRLLNPAYENDSVNTCALLTNAWSFTNPDFRPNTAGAGAIVVDISELNAGADLTPAIGIDNALFTANQTQDFVVFVLENNAGSTNGQITLQIPAMSGWTIGVEGSATSDYGGGTPVNNAQWTFSVDGGGNVTATSNPGFVVERNGVYILGFTATRKAGTSAGTNQNLSATILGGGDVTVGNNQTVQIFSAN